MPLKLLPMSLSELHIYCQISGEAFVPGIMDIMYPSGYSDKAMEYSVQSMQRRCVAYPNRHHFFKTLDTDLPNSDPFDKIVGISQWQIFPHERTEEEMQKEKEQGDRDEAELGPVPGIHEEARQDFGAAIKESKDQFIGRKAYVCLALLATRPQYERRGVGALSMAWGTKKADELNLPAWLEASPKGVSLYKRWGFEVVDQLAWDARKYGYHDSLTHVCMLRPSVNKREPVPQ